MGLTIMSMSRTGFAGRPGMDVLPTCSMAMIGMSLRASCSSFWIFVNSVSQAGLWGSTLILILRGWKKLLAVMPVNGDFEATVQV